MMPDRHERRRWDKLLIGVALICTLCTVVVVLVVAPTVLHVRKLNDENRARIAEIQKTTRAVCALREDLERRVEASQAFLREHPNGIPGIPAKTLRDGMRNQQRTIDALDIVPCK